MRCTFFFNTVLPFPEKKSWGEKNIFPSICKLFAENHDFWHPTALFFDFVFDACEFYFISKVKPDIFNVKEEVRVLFNIFHSIFLNLYKTLKTNSAPRLSCMFGDSRGAGQSWLSLFADTSQQLLDFGDCSAGVQSLGTRFSCSSWWCDSGKRRTDPSTCPTFQRWRCLWNRSSTGMLASRQRGRGICHRSTSKTDKTWSNKRRECIRKDRPWNKEGFLKSFWMSFL